MYSDKSIRFVYPAFLYRMPTNRNQDAVTRSGIVDLIGIRRKQIDNIDSITVCEGALRTCAMINDTNKPYWIDEDSGVLFIVNPTEELQLYKNSFGSGYQAFPACGWIDANGVSSQYAGQCYVIVISNGKKPYLSTFLLGENVGAQLLQKKYRKQINMYRRIAESAR
jgi:hypothetical protein